MTKYRTVIHFLIRRTGKKLNWFAVQLDYKINSYRSAFNSVATGRVIPNADRRRKLALILGCKITDLWEIDNTTGEIKSRRLQDWRREDVSRSAKGGKKIPQKSGPTDRQERSKTYARQKDITR